jgi:hypothetical protein
MWRGPAVEAAYIFADPKRNKVTAQCPPTQAGPPTEGPPLPLVAPEEDRPNRFRLDLHSAQPLYEQLDGFGGMMPL